jgi:hypothetical protein
MKQILPISVCIILVFASILSCDDRRNIKEFYFPTDELVIGKVYAYEPTEGTAGDIDYWYYKSVVRDSGFYFTASYYDPLKEVRQLVTEKIVSNGALAKQYVLFEPDTTGTYQKIEARLESPNTFPFLVKDSTGVFLFSLKYESVNAPGTQYLIRNRRYLGDGPDFELDGVRYPTIRFKLKEVYGNEQEGSAEIEGEGEELYAKGLGLVYYRKSVADGKYVYAYRLKKRMSMEEFIDSNN